MPRRVFPTIVVNINDDNVQPGTYINITRGTKFGNPYRVGVDGTREEVVALFDRYITNILRREPKFLDELKGKTLGCVCKPAPCHGDVIVKKLEGK